MKCGFRYGLNNVKCGCIFVDYIDCGLHISRVLGNVNVWPITMDTRGCQYAINLPGEHTEQLRSANTIKFVNFK